MVSKQNKAVKKRKTILIVDDDSILLRMYTQKFTAEGYEVLNAINGEEAYEVFKKGKIDMIICDLMLPKVSGVEFIEKLRNIPAGKEVPVIVWSNLQDEETNNKIKKLGITKTLAKYAVSLDKIVEIVSEALLAKAK